MNYKTNLDIKSKRDLLKSRMDDFTSFYWRGKEAFEAFGAFVVGGKDALKFYNGPGFSNKYIKPQFESANSLLTGVEFQTQKIDFTLGIYGFTIEEYRQLLIGLHPYEINDLCFSYAPGGRYRAKVAKIGDSTRYVLGTDADGNYRYYTEIKISFELQGASCLYSTTDYQGDGTTSNAARKAIGTINADKDKTYKPSDLNTPIDITFSILPTSLVEGDLYPQEIGLTPSGSNLAGGAILNGGKMYHVALNAILPFEEGGINKLVLFDVNLQHLSECVFIDTTSEDQQIQITDNVTPFHFRYLSESGIVFIQFGDSPEKLLTLQTSTPSGKRLCQTLTVNKFGLPGLLENSSLTAEQFKNIKLELICGDNVSLVDGNGNLDINVECYARTNII